MPAPENVIAAFSEDHVERLTGLTKRQLRYWHKTGFFAPTLASEGDRGPYSRIYSFRDVVGLKTINVLLKKHRVRLQHLREVAAHLDKMQDDLWVSTTIYVHQRRIVGIDETGKKADVLTGQYVLGIPLEKVINQVRQDADKLRHRSKDNIGQVTKHRYVAHNAVVLAGTRIPVRAIKNFYDAGYTIAQIIAEYPDLTDADVKAAIAHSKKDEAA